MSTVLTDNDARVYVAANIQHLLEEGDHSVYWLMRATGEMPNRIYPVVRGDATASAGLLHRMAEALGVTTDFLLEKPSKKVLEKFFANQRKAS